MIAGLHNLVLNFVEEGASGKDYIQMSNKCLSDQIFKFCFFSLQVIPFQRL